MAHWFRSDASLLERLYPDMVSQADDGITIGRVLEHEPVVPIPSNEAIAENDVVIYRLLHLVSFIHLKILKKDFEFQKLFGFIIPC
jgi:hypothetical protein